uniref:Uncharacterized protein n=1 Tax=Arundo donax TaxID=35708 RepID=A0A0A9H626_ARUDO
MAVKYHLLQLLQSQRLQANQHHQNELSEPNCHKTNRYPKASN